MISGSDQISMNDLISEVEKHHDSAELRAHVVDLRAKKIDLNKFCSIVRNLCGQQAMHEIINGLQQRRHKEQTIDWSEKAPGFGSTSRSRSASAESSEPEQPALERKPPLNSSLPPSTVTLVRHRLRFPATYHFLTSLEHQSVHARLLDDLEAHTDLPYMLKMGDETEQSHCLHIAFRDAPGTLAVVADVLTTANLQLADVACFQTYDGYALCCCKASHVASSVARAPAPVLHSKDDLLALFADSEDEDNPGKLHPKVRKPKTPAEILANLKKRLPPAYHALVTRAEQLTHGALLELIEADPSKGTVEAWMGLTPSDALVKMTRETMGLTGVGESARLHLACTDTKGVLATIATQLATAGLTMLELTCFCAVTGIKPATCPLSFLSLVASRSISRTVYGMGRSKPAMFPPASPLPPLP